MGRCFLRLAVPRKGVDPPVGSSHRRGVATVPVRVENPQKVRMVVASESGGRCLNPDCRVPLVEPVGALQTWLGQCAHVSGEPPGAERHDPTQSAEERKQKGAWIVQRRFEFGELGPRPSPKEFVVGESYSYLGRTYRLSIDRTSVADTVGASLQGGYIMVSGMKGIAAGERPPLLRRALVAWYRRQAARRLPERVAIYAKRAGVPRPPVLVRDQEKRWGSCSRRGEVRFNWRIMMAPMSLVDYVVAHEVCHLLVRDHSARFWRTLGAVLPDYEVRQNALRLAGLRLDL